MISFIRVVLHNLRNITHYPSLVLENVTFDKAPLPGDGVIRINGREYARIDGTDPSDMGWDIEQASRRIVRQRDRGVTYSIGEGGITPF